MFCNKVNPCSKGGGDEIDSESQSCEQDVTKEDIDDTPLEELPSSTCDTHQNSKEDKPPVTRQFSFAVSETIGDDVIRRFNATEGVLCFWRNFAYEDRGRPFLRAAHDANMENVANVLHREWKIKSPRIVLVVVSNIAPLHTWTNNRQLEHFQSGLIKAANTTEMWIFTPGTNTGVTKLIGDAVHNEHLRRQALLCHKHPNQSGPPLPPLTLIGVTREDFILYGDMLDGRVQRVEIENEGNQPEENKYELNPDHSHFIVVKDSTINKTGINHFLLKLEQYLSSAESLHCDIDASTPRQHSDVCSLSANEIPIVSLLIQGGYDCARLVLEHLKKQLPVVVVHGSGGLADLLAYTYHEVTERPRGIQDAEFIENSLKRELSNKIEHHFPQFRENTLARNMFRDRIMECVRYAHQKTQVYLTVLNLHSHACNLQNLDEHLLRALFKSQQQDNTNWHHQMQKDLLLTLDWNSPHVAMSEVFLKDPSNKFKIDKKIFEQALTRPNREDFVDLFLRENFQIHKYLTPRKLKNLFLRARRQDFFRTVCWEGALGHGLITKFSKNFVEYDLNLLIALCTGIPNFINTQEMSVNAMGMYATEPSSAERKSLTILILWAVFTHRPKLAKVLWQHSDQPIHIALIVSMIYEKLEEHVNDSNMRQELSTLSRDFSEMATSVLDASFSDSSCRAYDVLSEETSDWSYKTAVDIAAMAKNRTFLSHPCCQKWLSNLFLGNIRIRDLTWGVISFPQWLKVVLCAFFIFPMYIWIRFKTETLQSWDLHAAQDEDSDDEKDERDGEEEILIADPVQDRSGDFVRPKSSIAYLTSDAGNAFVFGHGYHREQVATMLQEKEVFIQSPPPLWSMIYLMWSAPVTKFWTFQIFYMMYLGFFSMAVLWPSCGNKELDIIVCSWTSLIVIEYIRRTYILYTRYKSVPLFFKCLEILLIVVFIVLYVLGRILNVGVIFSPYTGKVILCLGLLYFFYRLIAVYLPISPTLGPLLYRVKLMVLVDFVNFMRMTLLVIISGGIVLQAVLYPDYPFSTELFRQTFHRAWFSLFLTPIGELEGKHGCNATKSPLTDYCVVSRYSDYTCPNTGVWPYLFAIQYFVFLKLILLTLLYALFSATASKLASETDAIWKFQRYTLVIDFSNRLCLPPPLSIFSYLIMLMKWIYRLIICKYCKGRDEADLNVFIDSTAKGHRLSEKDYNYWRQLAQDYTKEKKDYETEKQITTKQMDLMLTITEDVEYQKKVMHQLKSRMKELDRMMNYSHVYLENIKHLTEKIQERGLKTETTLHVLSRHTPYPSTRVQRYPVPDKYVPWEVMWTEYDPVAYTRPKSDFTGAIQHFVDEDVLLMRATQDMDHTQLPVFQWNCLSSNPAGISIDRTSWVVGDNGSNVVYKLDSECVPRNIYGRTGLRGKGALCRWGPNHYVHIIISRWQKGGGKGLEFVIMRGDRRDQLSLPGGFVPGEQKYVVIQNLFKTKDSSLWKTPEDMLEFFKSCCEPLAEAEEVPPELKCDLVKRGYMDDPWNTDQAWREVELWHVHYGESEVLAQSFQAMLSWRLITEDIFIKLPSGQAVLLQDITNKLQPYIF